MNNIYVRTLMKIPQNVKNCEKKWTGVLEVKQQSQIPDHKIEMTLQIFDITMVDRASFGRLST